MFAKAKLSSYSYAALFTGLIFANLFSGGIKEQTFTSISHSP
jgi:hypothetical protein